MSIQLHAGEVAAAKAAVRRAIDRSGYGSWVSDAQCEQVAVEVTTAIEVWRASQPSAKSA